MPTILVTSQKFFNEFKNEIGFASNPSDFTTNLAGDVMSRIKAEFEIDVSWNVVYESPGNDPSNFEWVLDFSALPTFIITRNAGSFLTDGFAAGDLTDITIFEFGGSIFNYLNLPITALSPLQMVLDGTGILTFPVSPSSIVINGKEPQTALTFRFGLLGNGEPFNIESKVSGNDQGYYAGNIGFDTGGGVRSLAPVAMTRLGQYNGWKTGGMTVSYLSNPTAHIQRFKVEHEFMIVPYYLDGQLSNLQNLITPNLLNGANSIKYAFDAGFRTVLSNSNSEKKFEVDYFTGDVGWFNTNFNGFDNDYQIDSITYEEAVTAASSSGVLIGSETRIKISVSRLSGAFVGAERFGAYVSYLPDQIEYQSTILPDLEDNFIYDRALNYAGLAGVAGGDFISDISAIINAGVLEIEIVMEYSLLQKAFLSQKFSQQSTYFMIGVEVGDNILSTSSSDKVMLLADVGLYDQSPDIADLMHTTKFDLYTHEKQIGVDTGTTDAVTWNEDGLVVDFEFDVNLNLEAKLNSLNFVLVAYNNVTGRYWEIDNYMFSPAISVISGGVQQIFEDTTRGYILKIDDQFNDVEIGVGTQAAGLQKYSGRFAQKISWQNWIQDLDVDTVFFDNAEQFTNFNKKSSNYSLLNNYTIKLGIFSNVDGVSPLGVSGATDYLFLSPDIRVFDYEEDGNIPAVWSCVIETFNIGGLVNLGGAILTGQDTLFRTTWTNSNGPVATLTNLYGINRLEETNQPGYAITELSSLNLPLPTNQQVLKPSVGTLLDMTLVGGNVVMECLIDGNIALSGVNYNLSSRIHNSVPIVVSGKVTEAGVLKITESSVQKIIE